MRYGLMMVLVAAGVLFSGGCGIPARSASQSSWWNEDGTFNGGYNGGRNDQNLTPYEREIQERLDTWLGVHHEEVRDEWGEPDESDWLDRTGEHGEVYYFTYYHDVVLTDGKVVPDEDVTFYTDRDGFVVWYEVDFFD